MEPFAIHISDADLADLKSRLAHTAGPNWPQLLEHRRPVG